MTLIVFKSKEINEKTSKLRHAEKGQTVIDQHHQERTLHTGADVMRYKKEIRKEMLSISSDEKLHATQKCERVRSKAVMCIC